MIGSKWAAVVIMSVSLGGAWAAQAEPEPGSRGTTPPVQPLDPDASAHRSISITLPKEEVDQRMSRVPRDRRHFGAGCYTLGPEEWNGIFPDYPSEYGGTVCYRR